MANKEWHKNHFQKKMKDPEFRARRNTYRRLWGIQDRYGLTEAQVKEMLEAQGWKCGICHSRLEWPSRYTHIDHDHETNKVRALLCHACNTGIGLFNENKDTMMSAIHYLERHK